MQPDVQNRNTRSRLRRSLSVLIRRPLAKVGALLLAVIFWAVVIASDPTLPMEKVIQNAQVSVQGLETLRNRGYTIMTDLSAEPIYLKMRVEVTKANYDRATAETVTPRLELSQQIDGPGTYKLNFSMPSSLVSVLSYEPEYIEIDVEPYTPRKQIPIVVRQSGEPKAPLWISEVTIDPAQLIISGPKSLTDAVRRAVATLDLSKLSLDMLSEGMAIGFELQDIDGNAIHSPLLRVTSDAVPVDSIIINISAFPMREIPINMETAIRGVPQHGYMLGNVKITPPSVWVAAPQDTLDAIAELHVSVPLSVNSASESKVDTVGFRDLSSVAHISTAEVTVEAYVIPAEHVHTYNDLPITVMGMSPHLSGRLSKNRMSVVVTGAYQNVEGLKAEDIHLYVDVSGLDRGTHTLPVQCRIDGSAENHIQMEQQQLIVTLTQTAF